MTATPRLKITYATLRADNEELHALYEAGLDRGEARARRLPPQLRRRPGARRRRDVRGSLADRPEHPRRHLRQGRRASDVQDAVAAARRPSPPGRRSAWERLAILRRAADLISERQMRYGGADGDRGRQEPARGARRGRGGGRPHPLLRQTMEDNAATTTRWTTSATPTVHTRSILRPHGVFAVISPFNFPMALSAGPTPRPSSPATPSSSSRRRPRRCPAINARRGVPRRGRAGRRRQPRDGPGRHRRRRSSRRTRASTGSSSPARTRSGSTSSATSRRTFPRPCIVEMGGKNPAIVSRGRTSRRPPRASCAPRSGSAARSARRTPGSTSSSRSTTSSSGCSSRRPRRSTSATRSPRENWLGPIIDEKAVDRHQEAVAEARRDGTRLRRRRAADRRRPGPRLLRRADGRRRPAGRPSPVPRRAVRAVHRGPRGRLARRGAPAGERQRLRADGRRLQRGSGRGRSGSSTRPRPASCTSTAAPGATTGAWPGVQAFGGWKGSGSTGKAGLSMYYVAQFLREQSHTVVD